MKDYNNPLICTNCGHDYLNFRNIEIFVREKEDDINCKHVVVNNQYVHVDSNISGNPSERRNGLTVRFNCENCRHITGLNVFEDKGQIFHLFEEDKSCKISKQLY